LGLPPNGSVWCFERTKRPGQASPRRLNASDPRFNNLLILSPAGVELCLASVRDKA